MGADTEGKVWSLRDYAKRIQWGRFRSFQKFYEMQIAVFEHLQRGAYLSAMAATAQNVKATHQATLDFGSWKHAWPLTGLSDPAERRRLGGNPEEMETVNQFVETIDELDKRVHQSQKDDKKDGE